MRAVSPSSLHANSFVGYVAFLRPFRFGGNVVALLDSRVAAHIGDLDRRTVIARIITKGLIGLEDLNIGSGTFTRATSTGGTLTLHQINSTNLGTGFPLQGQGTPAGAINGVNTVFTLPTTPGPVVMIFRNGILQQGGGVDYTLAGTTVTFVAAPLSGDSIQYVY